MLIYLDEYRKAKRVRAATQDFQREQRDCVNAPVLATCMVRPADDLLAADPVGLDRICAMASRF
jgi:hypothetical protein